MHRQPGPLPPPVQEGQQQPGATRLCDPECLALMFFDFNQTALRSWQARLYGFLDLV